MKDRECHNYRTDPFTVSGTVTFSYDSLNRTTNMVDGVGTTKYAYSAAGQLLSEDGPFASDTVTNGYSNRLRLSLSLLQPTDFWTNGFAYDSTKRLTNVTSAAGAFGYLYDPTLFTHHASLLTLPNTSYITNAFDNDARLIATYLKRNDNANFDYYVYIYNPANQRTNLTRTDSSTVGYTYDKIGQLTVADSSINTEDRGYFYDAAWNLNRRTNNGVVGTFVVDTKNELTNAPSPVGTEVYDPNGNLRTNRNGSWVYVYDDENRLYQLYRYDLVRGRHKATEFLYDGLSRLRRRIEYHWEAAPQSSPLPPGDGQWVVDSEAKYVYDGWRVIQERDTNNTPTVSYTRGNDLSGTMEGAGGIGGLLARSDGYSGGNWTTHNYYFADGNGNITYLLNSSQTMVASYRYDPFGNTISSSGTLASANVYRFSSKEIHVNSGMYYYGYRFYDPNLQRWINRDPLDEVGFALLNKIVPAFPLSDEPNRYLFVRNNPITTIDLYGLADSSEHCKWILKQLFDERKKLSPNSKAFKENGEAIDKALDKLNDATKREERNKELLDAINRLVTLPFRIPVFIIFPSQDPDVIGGPGSRGGGMSRADYVPGLDSPGADGNNTAPDNFETRHLAILA